MLRDSSNLLTQPPPVWPLAQGQLLMRLAPLLKPAAVKYPGTVLLLVLLSSVSPLSTTAKHSTSLDLLPPLVTTPSAVSWTPLCPLTPPLSDLAALIIPVAILLQLVPAVLAELSLLPTPPEPQDLRPASQVLPTALHQLSGVTTLQQLVLHGPQPMPNSH